MLKDWDFAQFFPNWNAAPVATGTRSSEEPTEEKSSSSSGSSSGRGVTSSTSAATPPRMHRRNESDSALSNVAKNVDPLFSSRMPWVGGRHRSIREPTLSSDESVSLTEFSRKASQLELRSKPGGTLTGEFAPPRREKTDILDLRRLELKRELEERRRANGETGRHSQSEVNGSAVINLPTSRPSRPPLLKSTSEPCAPLALFRDHQQVRAGPKTKQKSPLETKHERQQNKKHPTKSWHFLFGQLMFLLF